MMRIDLAAIAGAKTGGVDEFGFSDDDEASMRMPLTRLVKKWIQDKNKGSKPTLREYTAKYFHNLDPESAYHDPKTRSMCEVPVLDKTIIPREEVCSCQTKEEYLQRAPKELVTGQTEEYEYEYDKDSRTSKIRVMN